MKTADHPIETLAELLKLNTAELLAGELVLREQLPYWIEKAGSFPLKAVLQRYQEYVQQHLQKLQSLPPDPDSRPVQAGAMITSLVRYINDTLKYCSRKEVADAALLAGVQDINHFKISGYGTLASFAKELALETLADDFFEMEINEKHIDDRLSQLALYDINRNAAKHGAICYK